MTHQHNHESSHYGKFFFIAIVLNFSFVVFEVVYGFRSHALSLLADAGHNMGDVIGLVLAWIASILAARVPTERKTYGYKSSTILASLANAVMLLVVTGALSWEAIGRFMHPSQVEASTIIWVATIGIAINTFSAFMFFAGRKKDINLKGAFLHLASDALVAAGVVVTGIILHFTGWLWLDPIMTFIISIVILISTWSLLKDSINLALHSVPEGIDIQKIKDYFSSRPEICGVHDVHVWAMSTTENALTAHLIQSKSTDPTALIIKATKEIHDKFGIEHITLQVESKDAECELIPDSTV